jgi:tetratricopeptide (TPR) repeat protein
MPRFDRLELDGPPPDDEQAGRQPGADVRDERHWLELADRERRQGHHETALRYYSRALEDNKAVIAGWVGQVQMLVLLGEYPEAELWARKALEIFKNQPDLLAGRAQAFGRLGDRRQAMACCDQALGQPGESAYRWAVRGELMLTGKETLDRHCFDKATAADPDWLVAAEIGLTLMHYRQPSKALPRFRAAIEAEPEVAFVWYQRAVCEKELGLADAARKSLRRVRELAPGHPDAALLLDALNRPGGFLGKILGLFGR